LAKIAAQTDYSLERILDAIAELRQFNPIPSSGFSVENPSRVVPDVIVDVDETGNWLARLADERVPQLRVSNLYRELAGKRDTDKSTKEYIRSKVGSAQFLIEAIEMRRAMLVRVSQAIVDHQISFFKIGPHAIKPLRMQDLADMLGIHITTVSRACDGKWMQTPQGMFSLRRFFVVGLKSEDGDEMVANSLIQIKIKEYIENEDKTNPFSDDELVKMLEEKDGIKIARRTISKYRQVMNIPSSPKRRQWDTK
jgi:RNA polymerase sigma-54 factor